MAEYLLGQGVDAADVRPETASTSTRENLLFSREVQRAADRDGATLVVTNDYHVLRAALLARSIGSDAQVVGRRPPPTTCRARSSASTSRSWWSIVA